MRLKLCMAVFALSTFAFAQHGHGGAMGGGSMGGGGAMGGSGMGASHGSMGSGATMDRGMGNAGMEAGSQSQTRSQQGMESGRTPSEILSSNTKLSGNLEKLLPQGTTAQQACDGFKNLGQCVAAIHVSHNLDIPFTDIKSKMTGTSSVSLGKAIKDLKPSVNSKAEAKKAEKQTKVDLKAS